MGIQGLLPLLKSIQKPCNLKKFSGQTIGVDAYGWLHRGTVSCAIDLALGKPTLKFVDFCMHRVRMLQHFGVTPYVVFDGDYLPGKAATEAERSSKREESKRRGLELYRLGKKSQAHLELQKAVDVSPEMAALFIESLRRAGVQYIVAPYEADAQLVYLERIGIISGILSEDSDLLVFGAKCLLTKLDQHGDCVEINRADFAACKDISLVGWTDADFRQMAILSGCDYLASMNKMGLKTAYRLIRKHKCIEKVLKAIQFEGYFKVPQDYLHSFQLAEKTFLHQRVFCPMQNALVMNTTPDGELDEKALSVIGGEVDRNVAIGVARGFLHPMTKQSLLAKSPKRFPDRDPTIQLAAEVTPRGSVKGYPSLDSYFKPNRMPLAEIDPNSFTPSPSQQNLLQQHSSGQWSTSTPVVGLPSTMLGLASAPIRIPTPRSAPTLSHRGPVLSSKTSNTTPRPTKRQRLCAEDSGHSGIETPLNGKVETSRFFSPTVPVNKCTISRKPQHEERRNHSPNLSSDDSLDEVLANLEDFDGLLKCQNKANFPIFVDADCIAKLNAGRELSGSSEFPSTSQTNMATTRPPISGHDPFIDTPSSSVSNSRTKKVEAGCLASVDFRGLGCVFAYQPTPTKGSAAKEDETTVQTPLSRRNLEQNTAPNSACPAVNTSKTKQSVVLALKTSASTTRSTPLQRLGANVLRRSISKGGSGALRSVSSRQVVVQKQERSPARPSPSMSLLDGNAMNSRGAHYMYKYMKKEHVGSEDLIVHDSEEERDTDTEPRSKEDSNAGSLGASFDFGKFTYGSK